jgi:hypothetical protein
MAAAEDIWFGNRRNQTLLISFAPILLVSYFIVQAIAVACLRVDVTIRDLFPFQLSISEQNIFYQVKRVV